MSAKPFPQLTPTGRSYTPGRPAETVFESQNGATSFVQFGGAFVNSKLDLTFANISDQDAADILQHYSDVGVDDRVTFGDNKGFGGMGAKLQGKLEDGTGLLKYRYDGPPEVSSVYPGISTVKCSFIGYLYGA